MHGGPAAKLLSGLFQAAMQGWQGLHPDSNIAAPNQNSAAHPAFLLCIACPRALYDATLDPAKTLVEFADWGPVLAAVRDAACQVWRACLPCSLAPSALPAADPGPVHLGSGAGLRPCPQRAPAPATPCSDSFAQWLADESRASAAAQWPATRRAPILQAASGTLCQKRRRAVDSAPCPESAWTASGDESPIGFDERQGCSKRPRLQACSAEGGRERGQPIGRSRMRPDLGSGSWSGSGLPGPGCSGSGSAAWCVLASAQRRVGAGVVPPVHDGVPAQGVEALQRLDELPDHVGAAAGGCTAQTQACGAGGLQGSARLHEERAAALSACPEGLAEAATARLGPETLHSRFCKRRRAASAPPHARKAARCAHANLACSRRSAAANPEALAPSAHCQRSTGRSEGLDHSHALDIGLPARPGSTAVPGPDGAARSNAAHASRGSPAGASGAGLIPGTGSAAQEPLPVLSRANVLAAAGQGQCLLEIQPKPTHRGQDAEVAPAPAFMGLCHGGRKPTQGLGFEAPRWGLAAEPRVLDLQELACGLALVPPALCRAHLASARPLAQASPCTALHAQPCCRRAS